MKKAATGSNIDGASVNARAQLAKDINLHKKDLSITFRRNIRYMLIIGLSSQIAVRAETVNVTAHRVGCNT